MKERPILFTPENAQKVFDGVKTQTRRVFKVQVLPPVARWVFQDPWWIPEGINHLVKQQFISTWPDWIKCPYGVVGDRLWIREAHGFVWPDDCDDGQIYDDGSEYGRPIKPQECVVEYKALSDGDDRPGGWPKGEGSNKWKPSIHMPRWACRTVVELTEIRVERLQDITEEDAKAEGCAPSAPLKLADGKPFRTAFRLLWESINGKGSWDLNPFVWVLTFTKAHP